jgi:hypothetical protein
MDWIQFVIFHHSPKIFMIYAKFPSNFCTQTHSYAQIHKKEDGLIKTEKCRGIRRTCSATLQYRWYTLMVFYVGFTDYNTRSISGKWTLLKLTGDGHSSVGKGMNHGLDSRGLHFRQGKEIFLFSTASRPHLEPKSGFYMMATGGRFPRRKAAGEWSWPLTSN